MPTRPDDELIAWTHGVSRLTVEAFDAAERGHWERVRACYEEREKWFAHNRVSSNLAQALLAMDAGVMERLAAAHAAVGQTLTEICAAHKQWKTLSTVVGEPVPLGGRLNRVT